MIESTKRRRGRTVTSREAVFQAIVDMHCANPPIPITKNSVADYMRLPFATIDTHIDRLYVDDQRLLRPMPGHYIPKDFRPARAITVTSLPNDRRLMVEIGDTVLHLTDWEVRTLEAHLNAWRKRFDPSSFRRRSVAPAQVREPA